MAPSRSRAGSGDTPGAGPRRRCPTSTGRRAADPRPAGTRRRRPQSSRRTGSRRAAPSRSTRRRRGATYIRPRSSGSATVPAGSASSGAARFDGRDVVALEAVHLLSSETAPSTGTCGSRRRRIPCRRQSSRRVRSRAGSRTAVRSATARFQDAAPQMPAAHEQQHARSDSRATEEPNGFEAGIQQRAHHGWSSAQTLIEGFITPVGREDASSAAAASDRVPRRETTRRRTADDPPPPRFREAARIRRRDRRPGRRPSSGAAPCGCSGTVRFARDRAQRSALITNRERQCTGPQSSSRNCTATTVVSDTRGGRGHAAAMPPWRGDERSGQARVVRRSASGARGADS